MQTSNREFESVLLGLTNGKWIYKRDAVDLTNTHRTIQDATDQKETGCLCWHSLKNWAWNAAIETMCIIRQNPKNESDQSPSVAWILSFAGSPGCTRISPPSPNPLINLQNEECLFRAMKTCHQSTFRHLGLRTKAVLPCRVRDKYVLVQDSCKNYSIWKCFLPRQTISLSRPACPLWLVGDLCKFSTLQLSCLR